MCLDCLKTVLRPHTTYVPQEYPKELTRFEIETLVPQTGPDDRTPTTGRPEYGKSTLGLLSLALPSAPSFAYLKGCSLKFYARSSKPETSRISA